MGGGIPYYFISNNEDCLRLAERMGWLPIFLNTPVSRSKILSATQAKIAKVLPHLFQELAATEFSVYFDDKQHTYPSKIYSALMMAKQSKAAMHVSKHPFLSGNVLDEFALSMLQPRYAAQRFQISEYIAKMVENGYLLRCEKMFATGFIVRNHTAADTQKINEEWYEHISKCGIQCQISFDLLAQKYKSINCFELSELADTPVLTTQ